MNRSGAARLDAAPNRLRGGNPPGKQAVNRASIARKGARRVRIPSRKRVPHGAIAEARRCLLARRAEGTDQ